MCTSYLLWKNAIIILMLQLHKWKFGRGRCPFCCFERIAICIGTINKCISQQGPLIFVAGESTRAKINLVNSISRPLWHSGEQQYFSTLEKASDIMRILWRIRMHCDSKIVYEVHAFIVSRRFKKFVWIYSSILLQRLLLLFCRYVAWFWKLWLPTERYERTNALKVSLLSPTKQVP